jgi:hypothetical protein
MARPSLILFGGKPTRTVVYRGFCGGRSRYYDQSDTVDLALDGCDKSIEAATKAIYAHHLSSFIFCSNSLYIHQQLAAMSSREVSHYVVTAHPPGGVLHTVKCNFLSKDSEVSACTSLESQWEE